MKANYKDVIEGICSNIHVGLVDFSEPRIKTSIPSQANSEFITNKQQGDWAEDVLFRAINQHSDKIIAVRYGKSDDLVAGDVGFKEFFNKYQEELDKIGKRPDILLFKKEDYRPEWGLDISMLEYDKIGSYVEKAIAGIEVRSSAYLVDKYTEETNIILKTSLDKAIELRNRVLTDYFDLLEQKRPELIPLLQQFDGIYVRSLEYRTPTWRSSQRLQELSSLLAEIKSLVSVIHKRNHLSITPKAEDLKVVYKWIMTYNVPHYYVQVFFDRIYGMSFKHILELVANPELEDEKYFIEQDVKNQKKVTIKIPSLDGICLAGAVTEPNHHSVRKELNMGRLLFYVKFDGGEAFLDKEKFETLFNCTL